MIDKVLSRPITFLMIFIAIIIVGLISFIKLPIELMPNSSFGEISIIYSVRGGIPPDKIENFVTKPVEEAVGGVSNLKDIISISKEGRSTVVLKFAAGTDMNVAVMETRESLSQLKGKLPSEVEKPIVAQYEQEDIPILMIGVTSPQKSPEELRKIVDDKIKERLARVEGVANVDVYGGRERKIIVGVFPNKLISYGLSMSEVINSINMSNISMLSGKVEEQGSSGVTFALKASGRFENLDEIRNLGLTVSDQGSIIRLKDIAVIKDSYLEPENISRLNENGNVTVYIQKETLASTVKVCESVVKELNSMKPDLPSDMIVSVIKDDSIYIKKALASMRQSLIIGALLAAAILLIFLRSFKLTLINFFTIPISVFLTVALLFFNKITLNVMTLGGLALGVGMLLDNSIVVIENIFRASEETSDIRQAIIKGTTQIIIPIVAATLTTIIVFLPIIFLSEDIRKMQGGMAITITFSLVASLFVATTLVPILFLRLKIRPGPADEEKNSTVSVYYKYLLGRFIELRYAAILSVSGVFLLALFIFSHIDMNLYEAEEENKFTINVELPTGAKLDSSDKEVSEVEALLQKYPEVKTISSKIEKWSSKVYVTLTPAESRERTKDEIIADLRPKLKEIQPAFIYFKESQNMAAKEVFVEIYGNDFGTLKELAMNVGGYLKAIPGLEDVKIRMREGRPEKLVMLDRKRLSFFGLSVSEIAENLHARMRGLVATRYHEKGKEIETIARQNKDTITNFLDLYTMKMMSPMKNFIQLSQVAEFIDSKGPSEIWRKNKKRFVQVSASRNKVSLEKAASMILSALKKMKIPQNYFYDIGGDYDVLKRTKKELYMALLLTVILVYLVLASLFESYLQPFIIMLSVPLALIGVVIALKLTKSNVTTGVIMGIIMLAGIVVNNAIMLVDRINILKVHGVKNYIIEGSSQRLRPIFMTVTTTILGLLPLAVKGGEGSALWKPLSITVIGGLVSSTLLVLFIVPSVYRILDRRAA